MHRDTAYKNAPPYFLFGILVLVAVVLLGYGFESYERYARQFRAEVEEKLTAITDSKIAGIMHWRGEFQSRMRVLCENQLFCRLVRKQLNTTASADERQSLQTWLSMYQTVYGYTHVFLLDPLGGQQASAPADARMTCPRVQQAVRSVTRSGRPVFVDLHFHDPQKAIHFSLVAPVLEQGSTIALVVFDVDAEAELFPLIQTWPTPSPTAETLIVRRDGNDVLFLNELRFQKNTALRLRIPLTRTEVPAVRAVIGQEGFCEGIDYRGEKVVADVRPLPGLPWSMVTRIDLEEVYAPLRVHLRQSLILGTIIILGLCLTLFFSWRQQSLRFYRKQAQDARLLQETNDELQMLFESMLNAFVLFESVFDDQGRFVSYRFVFINKAYESITGVTQTEVAGKTVHEVWPGTEPEWIRRYGEVAVTGISQVFEQYHDPTKKLYHCNVYRPGDSQERFCVIFEDITERSLAEMKLRISEQKYRSLMENLSTGVVVHGPDTAIMYSNPMASVLLGLPPEQLQGKVAADPYWAFLQEDGTPCSLSDYPVNSVLSSGEPSINRVMGVRTGAYSEPLWLICNAYPEHDESGRVARVVVTFVDISNSKRAAKQIARQANISSIFLTTADEEMYGQVLDIVCEIMHSPLGVFGYLDEDGALIVPTMTREVWDKCSVAEKTFRFPTSTWGDSSWPRALREKQCNFSNERSGKTPVGHLVVDRYATMPIVFGQQVVGLFQVANKPVDYTGEDIQALQSLADFIAPILNARLVRDRFEKKLQARNEELAQFSYAVSHDLRSPVVTIQTFIGYLDKDIAKQDSDQISRDLMFMHAATDKISRMLDELLVLIRVGHVHNPETEMPLQAIVKEAMRVVGGRIAQRGVAVRMTQAPLVLRGDCPRLVDLFQNLIDNAVKFMGDQRDPLIEIGFENKHDCVELFVRDNGIGIDPRYLGKLFKLFEKIDPDVEGIGMGLVFAKRIVKTHGGTIFVESKGLGKGTCFRFTLPGKGKEL